MNEKIRRLIIDNVFRGVYVDFNVMVVHDTLVIYLDVDSKRLYKSSGYFDPKYYDLIYKLADGVLDDDVNDFFPMVGYEFDEIRINYEKGDLDGYKNLFYALNDLNYDYIVFDGFYPTPWLYIQFNVPDEEVNNLYDILEDEFDLSVDDVILLSRYN